ncbi:MAG: NAD-dependent epimerase/dehydratase family protein [Chloroflexi bacterium]|nr:NAD-dependent epimerase/dehydratase family protein [Chloroflexota bacterium]
MSRILITGGTGFIGSRLALRYLAQRDSVRVVGQENNSYETGNCATLRDAGAEVMIAPVTDERKMLEAMEGIDVVFHLAAAQHEANVPDSHFWDVNVEGTRNVLEAAVKAQVGRFVHGSTIGVYGESTDGVLDESSPLRPSNIYGVTKLEAEKLVMSYSDRIPLVSIRISETYGPGDQRLLRLFKAVSKGRFFIIGNGENLHHPIFVEDLIDGLVLAASSDHGTGKIIVLAGKEAVSTNQMVETIAARLGVAMPKIRVPMLPMAVAANVMGKTLGMIGIQSPLHPRRLDFFRKSFVLSNKVASEVLQFQPQRIFAEGVKATAEWYAEMAFLPGHGLSINGSRPSNHGAREGAETGPEQDSDRAIERKRALAAKMEPFDSYWEGPSNIEKGYKTLAKFYRSNYAGDFPSDRGAEILVISSGPGYMVNLLAQEGYTNVLGIDSDHRKTRHAELRGLNCVTAEAFPLLEEHIDEFDFIFCESEINHLGKSEILELMRLCSNSLKPGGRLICHSMNGANPITGAEGLALNIDHFNTFTEYSMRQIFEYGGFKDVRVFPLNLYVFYKNPLNYVGIIVDKILSIAFRTLFIFYGKSNKIFTKKIAAVGRKED